MHTAAIISANQFEREASSGVLLSCYIHYIKEDLTTLDANPIPGVPSQAIDTGKLVFGSGQINIAITGEMVGETLETK